MIIVRARVFGEYSSSNNTDEPNEYIWTLITFALAARILLIFMIDEKLGPIIRMLYSTLKDSLGFLLIFTIILVAFTMASHMLFYPSRSYSTIDNSFLTMVSAALGSFDFYEFETRTEIGKIFLVVWIVIAAILILNTLIAVMSMRYEELMPQADADYVCLLLSYIDSAKYTDKYGGLVITPAPLNLLTAPLAVLYLTPIDKTNLSFMIARISYAPIMLLGVLCFVIYNVVYSVFRYFENFVRIYRNDETTLREKLREKMRWIVYGPCYLAYLSMLSVPVFVRYLLISDVKDIPKTFTSDDVQYVADLLRTYAQDNPDQPTLSWETAKEMLKSTGDSSRRLACLFILRKFMTPQEHQLRIACTLHVLENQPLSFLETFSIYEALSAGGKLHQEFGSKLVIV
jgi:hypothetical protein